MKLLPRQCSSIRMHKEYTRDKITSGDSRSKPLQPGERNCSETYRQSILLQFGVPLLCTKLISFSSLNREGKRHPPWSNHVILLGHPKSCDLLCTWNIRETKLPQVTVDQSHNSLVNETALRCTVKVFSSILEYPCTKSISFLSLNKKGKRRPRDWMGFSLQWTVIKLWITSTAHLSIPWNSFWDGCSDEIASPTMFINPGALGIYEVINYPQVTVDQSHNSLVNETALRRTVTVFSSVSEYPCCARN